MTSISALFKPDAIKATQLYKSLAKGTPPSVRNTLKMNNTLTNQLLFVTNGTIGVITFPILTTDITNKPCIIGTFGNDTDNLAPAAISGDVLHQSISALVPLAIATKYDLPVLTADPLTLEPPPPSTVGAGPDRLHYIFTDPTFAPVIAVLPATFSVPLGITAPLGWDFSTPEISEADFPCEAGRAWIRAVAHLLTHHDGHPLLSDPTVFNPTDLDLSPFAGHEMAPSVSAGFAMLNPTDEQYGFVLTVTRESIQARRNTGTNPDPAINSPDHTNLALERQARVMNEIVKAAVTPLAGSIPKEAQSRTDRETNRAIQDAAARYQLMFARLISTIDPNDNDVTIIKVELPDISDVFKEILETTKVSEAVRMTQEQFTYHLAQRSTSKNFHDASMNYDAKALDAPKVTALKRAHWADRPLSIEPDSIKDKLGMYHFAPPRIGSYEYEQRVANGCKIFRQEFVGEDKSRISAKAHDLDHTGKMESDTDLHSTIANFSAIATFITKHAINSELWKMVERLHDVWLHPDGRAWLSHHLASHKYIVAAIVLEFQQVVGLYVKIANSLEYRQAVKTAKQIDPRVYQETNERAKHIVSSMNNLIPGMTLGPFIIEPVACSLFYIAEKKDKKKLDKKPKDDSATRNTGRNEGRTGSGRRDEGRTPSRDTNRTDTRSSGAPPDLPPAQIAILKAAGLVKYSGPGRVPHPADILELNGSSGLTRICMMFVTRDRFCRYEENCKQKHIKKMADFTPENKIKFQNFIQNHTHFQMATTGTTP